MSTINIKVIETSSWSLNDYYEDDDNTLKFRCDHEWRTIDEDNWFDCDEDECIGIEDYEQEHFLLEYLEDLDEGY